MLRALYLMRREKNAHQAGYIYSPPSCFAGLLAAIHPRHDARGVLAVNKKDGRAVFVEGFTSISAAQHLLEDAALPDATSGCVRLRAFFRLFAFSVHGLF